MTPKPACTIAYYTVVANERMGWTGGLLTLNAAGRPLEFQCTLPVRPSKTHEILYGPTLRSHLVSEVIGPLLLKQSRTPISLLCCEQPEALSIESLVECPVVLVDEAAEPEEGPISPETINGSESVVVCDSKFWVPVERVSEVEELSQLLADFPDAVEPFSRIREAIEEAHSQIARQKLPEAA